MKRTYISIFIIGFALVLTSCEDFLNINEDPNNPVEAPLGGLLTNSEVTMTGVLGMQGLGGYTTHFVSQLVSRGTLSDYGIGGQDFNVTSGWTNIYASTLADLNALENQARTAEAFNSLGIAQILKAYTYSSLVDLFGDVPYTEANLGALNTAPKYDDDAAVYDSCLLLLDQAIVNLGKEVTTPLNGDLFYGTGSEAQWIQVANTLKLRLLTQSRLAGDVSAEVTALINADNFITSGANDFELDYGTNSNPDNRNPLYVSEYAPVGSAVGIDPFFYEVMSGLNTFFPNEANPYTDGVTGFSDPRVPYYFYNQINPATDSPENPTAYFDASTGFLSIYKFSFNIDPNEGFDQGSSRTVIGLYPGGGRFDDGAGVNANFNGVAVTPQRLVTYYNMLFNRAELALAGVTSEDPRVLFEDGVRAAFAKVNEYANGFAPALSQATIDGYVADALGLWDDAANDQMEILMIEKWKANFGAGIVSYNDYRRTGFPRLHDGDTDDGPRSQFTDRQRDYPTALAWSSAELSLNPNSPSQKIPQTYKVFWDK